MTRSYGGGPERGKPRSQEGQAPTDRLQGWKDKLDNLSRYEEGTTTVAPERVDMGKRVVALIIDVFAAYMIALIISYIPFVNMFLTQHLTMALILVTRDYFYGGRGLGKNLMGLQVVDLMTGRPCSFAQSVIRNSLILGPILVYSLLVQFIRIVPIPYITEAVTNIFKMVGTLYTICVIPYEAYRAYNRADSMRLGDQIAGTAVVESNMDFSEIIPRQ